MPLPIIDVVVWCVGFFFDLKKFHTRSQARIPFADDDEEGDGDGAEGADDGDDGDEGSGGGDAA